MSSAVDNRARVTDAKAPLDKDKGEDGMEEKLEALFTRCYHGYHGNSESEARAHMLGKFNEYRRVRGGPNYQKYYVKDPKVSEAFKDRFQDISWVFEYFARRAGWAHSEEELGRAKAYFKTREFEKFSEDRVDEFFMHMSELKTPHSIRAALEKRFAALLDAKNWDDIQVQQLGEVLAILRRPDWSTDEISEEDMQLITYAKMFVEYYSQSWLFWGPQMQIAFEDRRIFSLAPDNNSLDAFLNSLIKNAGGYDKLKNELEGRLKAMIQALTVRLSKRLTPDERARAHEWLRSANEGLDSNTLPDMFAAVANLSRPDVPKKNAKHFMLTYIYDRSDRLSWVTELIYDDLRRTEADPRTVLIAAFNKLYEKKFWSGAFVPKFVRLMQKLQDSDGSPMTYNEVRSFVVSFSELSDVTWSRHLAWMTDYLRKTRVFPDTIEAAPISSVAANVETDEDTVTEEEDITGPARKTRAYRNSSKTVLILSDTDKAMRTSLVRALVDKVKREEDESKKREAILTAIRALKDENKDMSTKTTKEIDRKLNAASTEGKSFFLVVWVKYYAKALGLGLDSAKELANQLTKRKEREREREREYERERERETTRQSEKTEREDSTKKAAATGKGGDTRPQRFAQNLLAILGRFDEATEQS